MVHVPVLAPGSGAPVLAPWFWRQRGGGCPNSCRVKARAGLRYVYWGYGANGEGLAVFIDEEVPPTMGKVGSVY